ncbi:unnamed protein product, partial [Allacma fusca]
LKFLSVDTCA